MAQQMNNEQRLRALEAYNPQEHLITIRSKKTGTETQYYPASWRLYELRLRFPHITIWSEIILLELLGPIAVPEFTENTLQIASTQQLLLRYANEQGINIQSGFIPAGTSVRPRQAEEIKEKEYYLLDIDVFREFPPFRALSMDTDAISHHVEMFHKTIYRIFRWSVTDQYLATLRG